MRIFVEGKNNEIKCYLEGLTSIYKQNKLIGSKLNMHVLLF